MYIYSFLHVRRVSISCLKKKMPMGTLSSWNQQERKWKWAPAVALTCWLFANTDRPGHFLKQSFGWNSWLHTLKKVHVLLQASWKIWAKLRLHSHETKVYFTAKLKCLLWNRNTLSWLSQRVSSQTDSPINPLISFVCLRWFHDNYF